jgi:hypothetical protein
MTMIKFLLIFNFLQVEACLRTSEKKLPSLQPCTRESNYGKKLGSDAKIVGGVTAEKNQWSFIARLTIGFDDGQESLCGGTIIDNNWVLTYVFSSLSISKIVLELPTPDTKFDTNERPARIALARVLAAVDLSVAVEIRSSGANHVV